MQNDCDSPTTISTAAKASEPSAWRGKARGRFALAAERWATASERELGELLTGIGVGAGFCRDGAPPNFTDPGLSQQLERFPHIRGGVFVYGPVRTHKSHFLAARCVDAARRGFSARFVGWGELAREVRSTYATGSRHTEDEIVRRLIAVDYLALDDFGLGEPDGRESDFRRELAFSIIDGRYRAGRSCVTDFSSNLKPDLIAQHFGERVAWRVFELATPLLFLRPDGEGSLW